MVDKDARKKQILFVCIENSSRSVMAEAFARQLGMNASSAGTLPSTHVNPLVVDVMKEVGLDVSQSKPKRLTEEMIDDASLVILTDSSLDKALPASFRRKMRKKLVQWNVADPQGRLIEEVRFIRDQIKREVERIPEEGRRL